MTPIAVASEPEDKEETKERNIMDDDHKQQNRQRTRRARKLDDSLKTAIDDLMALAVDNPRYQELRRLPKRPPIVIAPPEQ